MKKNSTNKTPSIKKQLLAVFLVVATELIGFGLIIPILPLIGAKYQSSHMMLGVLMASYSFMQFLSAPILGALSDKYGRKPILVLSKAGTVAAYGILAFSGSYWMILISRLIDGFTGGNITTARAYVADITTPENRSKGMAIIGISFGVGFLLGPALGSVLYGTSMGYMLPALVAGGLSALALVFTLLFVKEPEQRKPSISAVRQLLNAGSLIKHPTVVAVCMLQLVFLMMFSGFETSFAIYTHDIFGFDEKKNSILFIYVGFLALMIQGYFSRKTTTKFKPFIIAGMIFASIGLVLMGGLTNLWVLAVALASLSLGFSMVNTYLPSLLSTSLSESEQGVGMGIYEGIGSLSRILGPLVGFFIISYSLRGFFVLMAAVVMLVAVIFAIGFKQRKVES